MFTVFLFFYYTFFIFCVLLLFFFYGLQEFLIIDFTPDEVTYYIKRHIGWVIEQAGVVPPTVSFASLMILSFFLFTIGVFGFLFNRSHLILTIISAELILLSAFLNFSYASHVLNDPKGQIYAILVLVVAAAESAIGLSLIVNYYIIRKNINIESLRFLRG
jgi:NADH-quinone oxidoreductase subunit K